MSNGSVVLPASVVPTLQAMGGLWQSLVKELRSKTKVKVNRLIDPDQWWFWTPEWQAGEKQADLEIEAGLGKTYDDTDDLVSDLKKLK